MRIDSWIEGYKVEAFDWFDGKSIYINIQCFRPGQSITSRPVFDKSFWIDKQDENIVRNFTSSIVLALAKMEPIKDSVIRISNGKTEQGGKT